MAFTSAALPAAAESFALEDVGQINLSVAQQQMTLSYTCEGSSETHAVFVEEPVCSVAHEWQNGVLSLHFRASDIAHAQITCLDYAREINLRQLCPKH